MNPPDSIIKLLSSIGYVQNQTTQVWTRQNSNPIEYTDGTDVEHKLNSILDRVVDLSADSEELNKFITDWPTRYYFSSYRANLLRPIKKFLSGNVLEIGSGCGALTRFLGENAKSVIAIEGGVERAKICSRRCKDLNNVQVICEQFENFSSDIKFDAITLIGVLEYSRIYGGGKEGPRNLLTKARQMLAPNGVLIVAIENQLGAKYFAGAKEDHVNEAWFGISDLYDTNSAVTFGKVELTELLKSAGFEHTDFFIPLPDYKLPTSVIHANSILKAKSLGFDSSLFAAMSVSSDPNNADYPTFPLELTSRVIGKNNLSLDLANSFLVVCKFDQMNSSSNDDIPVVYHYGSTRKKIFSKETILRIREDKIEIDRNPIYPHQESTKDGFFYVNWSDQRYIHGKLHIEELFQIVNRQGWCIDQIVSWAQPWIELLRKNIVSSIDGVDSVKRLPNNFLDATPFNLIKIDDVPNTFEFIDLEWCDSRGPEFLHVVIRGLLGCFDKISSLVTPNDTVFLPINHLSLLQQICEKALLHPISFAELNRALNLENQFRIAVTGQGSEINTKMLLKKSFRIRPKTYQPVSYDYQPNLASSTPQCKAELRTKIHNLFTQYKSLDQTEYLLRDKSRIEKIIQTINLNKNNSYIPELSYRINKYPSVSFLGLVKDCIRLFRSLGLLRTVYKQKNFSGIVFAIVTWLILRASGLFDYKYYLEKNPALSGVKFDLLLHYIVLGVNDNLQPNILFDTRWYRNKYQNNSKIQINPLLHYIIRSPKHAQSPHPIFDTRYFRARHKISYFLFQTDLYYYLTSAGAKGYSSNPLFLPTYYYPQLPQDTQIRYDLLSDYLNNSSNSNLNPNTFFDSQFYLKNNPDVFKSKEPAFLHYCMHGSVEGRDPCEEFSVSGYYRFNPDVKDHGREALSHFIESGIYEARKSITRIGLKNLLNFNRPDNSKLKRNKLLPPKIDITELLKLPSRVDMPPDTQGIDIIVPVYKGKDETIACIASVLRSNSHIPFRLIVVDDCSPDVELSKVLSHLSEQGKLVLIRNDSNLGFVQSVNKGMQYSKLNDVVLLNSDTEVYSNWIERLNLAAYSSSDIGTVTPYSNSATICSYPSFCLDTSNSLEITCAQIDQIASEVNSNTYVEIPTAVGFCMYIKRVCLNKVGLFDADKFGLGYGEENDFCLRASMVGYRHILAADTYVLHYGSTSFVGTKQQRVEQATQVINRDFPRYQLDVQEFINKDPAQLSRLKIDLARVERFLLPKRFLFVSHVRGGGTRRHMEHLEVALRDVGVSVLYLESSTNESGGFFLRVSGLSTTDIPTLSGIEFSSKFDLLESILNLFEISHAHIHSMIDFKLSTVGHVLKLLKNISIQYDVTIHDYAWFCPRLHMVDHTDFYCGGAERNKCQKCINLSGSSWGNIDIDPFLHENELFLKSARRVFCPSYDVLNRIMSIYPNTQLQIKPHPTSMPILQQAPSLKAQDSDIRTICLLGAIGKHKGSEILLNCVKDAHDRNLPLKFVVIGLTDNLSELLKYSNVFCTGAYEEEEIYSLINRYADEVCWFPSVCPETYSYTLNAAFAAGLYPVSFDFGAIAERIQSVNWGQTMSASLRNNPSEINNILQNIRIPNKTERSKIANQFYSYPDILVDYYNLLL